MGVFRRVSPPVMGTDSMNEVNVYDVVKQSPRCLETEEWGG
jgi:hypothetical protein